MNTILLFFICFPQYLDVRVIKVAKRASRDFVLLHETFPRESIVVISKRRIQTIKKILQSKREENKFWDKTVSDLWWHKTTLLICFLLFSKSAAIFPVFIILDLLFSFYYRGLVPYVLFLEYIFGLSNK